MAEGQVYCLDTITEKFLEIEGNYELAKLESSSLLDLADDYLLAISSLGRASVHKVHFADEK
jgi:hypothetical protein